MFSINCYLYLTLPHPSDLALPHWISTLCVKSLLSGCLHCSCCSAPVLLYSCIFLASLWSNCAHRNAECSWLWFSVKVLVACNVSLGVG